MKLTINSHLNFDIENGEISSKGFKSFLVKELEDEIIIKDSQGSSSNNNNTIVSNNTVSLNGVTMDIANGHLNIIGKIDSITLNGNEISLFNKASTQKTQKGVTKYKFKNKKISSIESNGSGKLFVYNNSIIHNEELTLTLKGSGKIVLYAKCSIEKIMMQLMGSGNIGIDKVVSKNCLCNLMGSGNIILKNSAFNSIDVNLLGSGDVKGENTLTHTISRNITGSGSVYGIKKS